MNLAQLSQNSFNVTAVIYIYIYRLCKLNGDKATPSGKNIRLNCALVSGCCCWKWCCIPSRCLEAKRRDTSLG